jgi:hypothetical protein
MRTRRGSMTGNGAGESTAGKSTGGPEATAAGPTGATTGVVATAAFFGMSSPARRGTASRSTASGALTHCLFAPTSAAWVLRAPPFALTSSQGSCLGTALRFPFRPGAALASCTVRSAASRTVSLEMVSRSAFSCGLSTRLSPGSGAGSVPGLCLCALAWTNASSRKKRETCTSRAAPR